MYPVKLITAQIGFHRFGFRGKSVYQEMRHLLIMRIKLSIQYEIIKPPFGNMMNAILIPPVFNVIVPHFFRNYFLPGFTEGQHKRLSRGEAVSGVPLSAPVF